MAIGLGRVFGFHFLENFDHPYVSRSVTEFWRRWHISLSTWIRDYLYVPLGGSRKQTALARSAVLVATMTISGLWHGAAWTFVIWGLWHGLGLVACRATGFDRHWSGRSRPGAVAKSATFARGISWALTFGFVVVGFGLFRAHDLPWFVRGLARGGGFAVRGELLAAASIAATTAAFALPLMLLHFARQRWPDAKLVHSVMRWSMVALVVLLAKEGGREFIYFQF
jgi:alginate O-acetyltransferase complex protein AlgI